MKALFDLPFVALYTARADAGKDEGQPDDPHGRYASPSSSRVKTSLAAFTSAFRLQR
jgi:hypothetical protein